MTAATAVTSWPGLRCGRRRNGSRRAISGVHWEPAAAEPARQSLCCRRDGSDRAAVLLARSVPSGPRACSAVLCRRGGLTFPIAATQLSLAAAAEADGVLSTRADFYSSPQQERGEVIWEEAVSRCGHTRG